MSKFSMVVLIIGLISCKPATLPAVPQTKTLEALVAEKLGDGTVIQKNKDSTFALCIKENPSTLSVAYLVVKLNDLTVVEQDKLAQATLTWIDTYKIEIKTTPGMVKKDEQPLERKIIDVTKYTTKL